MKRIGLAILFAILICGALYEFLNRVDSSAGSAPALVGAPADANLVARGEYLTRAADCEACHTESDGGKPFAGGVPFVLPFGTIYSSNITSDAETGIGRYTDDDFVRAIHDGIRKDGQHLYSAFPYTSYTQISRADALAIKAYLFSLPKVFEPRKPPSLPFPFNQRWAMGFWNAAFFKNERFVADKTKSAEWNAGAYLAIALGHCGECHTPRNIGFGLEHGKELAGAPLEGWRAYNITPEPNVGIGVWTDADIATYLSTGHSDGHGSAGGKMAEAIALSLQYLKPQDMSALVTYLRSVSPQTGSNPITIDRQPARALAADAVAPTRSEGNRNDRGFFLFEGACASCHQWNGLGRQTAHASLIGSRSVNDPEGTNVVQSILHGADHRIGDVAVFMPKFESAYTDADIAALANYVIGQFGNKEGKVTAKKVASLRKESR